MYDPIYDSEVPGGEPILIIYCPHCSTRPPLTPNWIDKLFSVVCETETNNLHFALNTNNISSQAK